MNIPYVKVNNQKEFEKVVAKMERETGLKAWEDLFGMDNIYNIVGVDKDNEIMLFNRFNPDNKDLKIISANEYLTGIRENFTLGDLEDGMVVELRDSNERFYIVLNGKLVGYENYLNQKTYNNNFTSTMYTKYDIIKIYKPINIYSFENTVKELNLTLIFDAETHRNKSKISQRKSEIETEIKKLQEELKSLEVK